MLTDDHVQDQLGCGHEDENEVRAGAVRWLPNDLDPVGREDSKRLLVATAHGEVKPCFVHASPSAHPSQLRRSLHGPDHPFLTGCWKVLP